MKKIIIFLLIINFVFLTACWDMVELNDRAFPYTVGFDLNPEGDTKFEVTFSQPNIYALGSESLDEELVYVIPTKGDGMFDAAEELTKELYQPQNFKHLKVVIISREVAQNKQFLLEILDGVERDFITNNNASLLITDSARDLIKFTLESTIQQVLEGTIYSILKNNQKSAYFTPINASEFIREMDETGASIIPIGGIVENKNIRIEGGAVFKDYRYKGQITPEENRAIAILTNKIRNIHINVEHGGYTLSLMISEAKSKKRLADKENLVINFDINLEGHIHSHMYNAGHEVDNETILKELEEETVKVVKGEIDDVITKLQREFNSDVLFISDYLRKFHPSIWEKIEDDYDSIFPHMEITTKVDVKIRRRGLTK